MLTRIADGKQPAAVADLKCRYHRLQTDLEPAALMHSPVLALEGNVIHAFENPNGSAVELLRRAIAEGKISQELETDYMAGVPRAPRIVQHADRLPTIQLQVAHLELVWAFIYGWMVVYEWGVQRPMIEGTHKGLIHFDTPFKFRAASLLDWAASLKDGYSPWPEGLPSPTHHENEEEKTTAEKANGIFEQAIAFCMFHEFAHTEQGHLSFLRVDDADPIDAQSVLEMEREADDFAYRVMVSPEDTVRDLAIKAWPMLAAVLSSFYLIHGPQGVYQERHPHLHQRVEQLLAKFNFATGMNRDYFHHLSSTVLKLSREGPLIQVRTEGDIDAVPQVFETVDDALGAELDLLDGYVEDVAATRNRK